ncbi:peptidoglycan DD-metalloendopeptidase family protein [Streptomyces sp. TRM64462]|uniref:peptidoglycan DD-metalloendopeptidase family protein n=1 Tax=Streptomyces sp. TRM64462 TaxID=2741726 RepID=UPI0015862F50|nr:peptidoglycan DD-metalloendopeptidase family protein [Streptomyces sp. TRM64462]
MNDQHPHAGYVGDDAYATGSYETGAYQTTGYDTGGYGTGAYDMSSYETGSYDTGTYGTAAYDTGAYTTANDALYGAQAGTGYDAGHSGQYDSTQWNAATATQQWDESSAYTGQWDATAWNQAHEAQQTDAAQQSATATATAYDTTTGQWYTGGFDTGAYDATAWNYASTTAETPVETFVPEQYDYAAVTETVPEPELHEPEHADHAEHLGHAEHAAQAEPEEFDADTEADTGPDGSATEIPTEPVVAATPAAAAAGAAAPRSGRRAGGSRGRRRTPAKRSALLTVAVPSACVMGVAGIAAASVSGLTGNETKDESPAVAADDPAAVKPAVANSALDTQLAALSADARDFGDRASRTQERIDLKERQEAERKKRAEEAARREAMRPKFALPVSLHQLSARYGQAGINWMSLHTGIDFPVQYGTPVMAATDGTVRTQWNSAYGNMVIVTAKDGTETWYCHLSSAKIRSGPVKAGDVIAYSGNSGNSTGPHLHFEVRPGGGAAIDPEQWLRNKGLSPTG